MNPTPTTQGIDRVLEAMQLIAFLSENEIAQGSYQLFHVVMRGSGLPHLLSGEEVRCVLSCTGPTSGKSTCRGSEVPQDIPFPSIITPDSELTTRGGQNLRTS